MPASRPVVPPVPPGRARAALVVDVDGVVSAVHPAGDAWGDEVTAGHLFGPVRVSPTLCRRLDALGALPHVVPLWLTSWPAESRERMNPFPGRDWATLAAVEGAHQLATQPDLDRLGWWKWDALRTWLQAHRQIRSLVWCDDDLSQPLWAEDVEVDEVASSEERPRPYAAALEPEDAPFVTTTAAVIDARLAAMGVAATLVAPATSVGLTREELDRVEAAVGAARAHLRAPLPAAPSVCRRGRCSTWPQP